MAKEYYKGALIFEGEYLNGKKWNLKLDIPSEHNKKYKKMEMDFFLIMIMKKWNFMKAIF